MGGACGTHTDCCEGQTEEVIFDHLHATAFQHTPLGRTILGPAQNVRTITKDHLQKYISTHYTTSRMVIVASGAVKHEDLVEQVKKLFTKLSSDPTTTSQLVAKGPAIFSEFSVLKSFGFLFLLFFLFFLGSDSGCFGSLLIFCIKWGSGERERRVMLFCGFVYKVVIF